LVNNRFIPRAQPRGTGNGNGGAVGYVQVTVAESPYTVQDGDNIIGVDSSGGPVTIVFPLAANIGVNWWLVNDETGAAGRGTEIFITTTGGETIDTIAPPVVLSVPFADTGVYSDGVSQFFTYG
jgi:hypothetical protein